MAAFLVTGNPGSGKSTLAQELARRGLATIDPDYDPELSFWEDDAGNRVSQAMGAGAPDEQWLRAHRWVWNRSRLQDLLTQQPAPVFVCGIALNIDQVLDLFDRLFLLRIDAVTQEERLLAHDTSHPPGRSEAGRQQIRDGRPIFEAQMLKLGAIALDGAASTDAVADQLLALVLRR
jgi:energy-coupling factor transporter ATP-binding protein EcfA2